jgi:hypothetical protein
METLGKYLLIFGAVLLIAGGLVFFGAKAGLFDQLPLGRLPGDFHWQIGGISCFLPLATSIVLSVILTVLLNLIARLTNR